MRSLWGTARVRVPLAARGFPLRPTFPLAARGFPLAARAFPLAARGFPLAADLHRVRGASASLMSLQTAPFYNRLCCVCLARVASASVASASVASASVASASVASACVASAWRGLQPRPLCCAAGCVGARRGRHHPRGRCALIAATALGCPFPLRRVRSHLGGACSHLGPFPLRALPAPARALRLQEHSH